MQDICDYDCLHCKFPDCLSDMYLGREVEAHARVVAALAVGGHLRKPRKPTSGTTWKNEWQQRTGTNRHERGLCVNCGEVETAINPKTGEPKMLCPSCQKKQNERARLRYQRRKAAEYGD